MLLQVARCDLVLVVGALDKIYVTLTFDKSAHHLASSTWSPLEAAGLAIQLHGDHKTVTTASNVPIALVHQLIKVALGLAVRLHFALLLEIAVVVSFWAGSVVHIHDVVACMVNKPHVSSQLSEQARSVSRSSAHTIGG